MSLFLQDTSYELATTLRNVHHDSRLNHSSQLETTGLKRKRFQCPFCTYQTLKVSHYKDHQRIHTHDYIKCHLCPREFASSSNYGRHMKAHAGLIKCEICGKQYWSITGLNHHRKIHHARTNLMD